ncbi:endonuclease YncB(thermonuclease family) [Bradyrhizobium yuanmingense]
MLRKVLIALSLFAIPSLADAAEITGTAKVRAGDAVVIGTTRIRLGGIDAPAIDQLCLNTKSERWTCGVAARDELARYAEGKTWVCRPRSVDRRGRTVARCEVGGEDIQKWLVRNGWALAYAHMSRDYEADEKAAREAKAGMWQGAFIAPWDWRVRNKKTAILGATKPPDGAHAVLLASASGPGRAVAGLHHQGQRQQLRGVHLSPADQPLVHADQDEDQQGHPLVLLGRGGRSGRLPGDEAITQPCILRAFLGTRRHVKA